MNQHDTRPDASQGDLWKAEQSAPHGRRRPQYHAEGSALELVQPLPDEAAGRLDADIEAMGESYDEPEVYRGSHGRTMFDSPTSEDNTITVLLPKDDIRQMPAQSLVRIKSRPDGDGRSYLGIVVKGPFAEPDGLRADAPPMVITAVRGGIFMPNYHGRVQVELIGQEMDSGAIEPPRFRPLPNSPVFVLNAGETARIMQTNGQVRLGLAVGHEDLEVAFPLSKQVLPRHTGILGTTGGGKSTTVSGLIGQLQAQGVASILIDTEGEYTEMDQPTEDGVMLARLEQLHRRPAGVEGTALYHLVGRDTSNPNHPHRFAFSLRFSKISPYAVGEILELNEAQEERFFKAYDLTKLALERLGIYPRPNNEADRRQAQDADEFERGWPGMTLQHLHEIVGLIALHVDKQPDSWAPATPQFANPQAREELKRLLAGAQLPGSLPSWRTVQGKLGRLRRLQVFDRDAQQGPPLDFERLIQPGQVSIVDLSDAGSTQVNNLAIAELLRGVMDHQDDAYERTTKAGAPPTPVVVFIEEAHEFLSAERIKRMEVLFEQVARIARRGRKRWLGLVFITQLPQHLPDEVLGLINKSIRTLTAA